MAMFYGFWIKIPKLRNQSLGTIFSWLPLGKGVMVSAGIAVFTGFSTISKQMESLLNSLFDFT